MIRKDIVLMHPIEDLLSRIREINRNGPTSIEGTGSGRYGLALERELGIEKNSSKKPDFYGIEIKTKASANLQTLFSRTPSEYLSCRNSLGLLQEYGYEKNGRTQLYTSVNSKGDSLGFRLSSIDDQVVLNYGPVAVLTYHNKRLIEALKSKHTESVFVEVQPITGQKMCYYPKLQHCSEPSFDNFLALLHSGKIFLDLTLSLKNRVARDHGFLWRLPADEVPSLFANIEEYELI
ncbi:MAG: MvaI/BcnI family restriction endonuclease [Rubripirellula sp.]